MIRTTIEKANSILKKIEWLKEIIYATDQTRKNRTSGKNGIIKKRYVAGIDSYDNDASGTNSMGSIVLLGIGHVNAPNHIYYERNLLGRVGGVNDELLERAAIIAIYNEACRLLEEAEIEPINIGVITVRETPKVKTSKLKKILNKIFSINS